MIGIEIIAAERKRQVEKEGWTAEHDSRFIVGELGLAAACYAIPPEFRNEDGGCGDMWPWGLEWWNPTKDDRIRELAKAGALIAAEIDRLQKKESGK